MDIGKKLKEARNNAKIHQADAAEKMGMSRPTLSAIEADKRKVTAEEIISFSKLYKVDAMELLFDEDNAGAQMKRLLAYHQKFSKLTENQQKDVLSYMDKLGEEN